MHLLKYHKVEFEIMVVVVEANEIDIRVKHDRWLVGSVSLEWDIGTLVSWRRWGALDSIPGLIVAVDLNASADRILTKTSTCGCRGIDPEALG